MHRSDSATQLDNISPAEVSGGFPTTWKTLCWYYPPESVQYSLSRARLTCGSTGRDFSAEYREAARTNSLLVLQAEKSRSQSTEDWQRHLAALYHSPHAHAALTWLSEHPEVSLHLLALRQC